MGQIFDLSGGILLVERPVDLCCEIIRFQATPCLRFPPCGAALGDEWMPRKPPKCSIFAARLLLTTIRTAVGYSC